MAPHCQTGQLLARSPHDLHVARNRFRGLELGAGPLTPGAEQGPTLKKDACPSSPMNPFTGAAVDLGWGELGGLDTHPGIFVTAFGALQASPLLQSPILTEAPAGRRA